MTRADFTAPEWRYIQTAIVETINYVSLSSPGFFSGIKEKHNAKKIIEDSATTQDTFFIEEVTNFDNFNSPIPRFARDDANEVESQVLRYITKAVDAIRKRDINVPVFKSFIIDLAKGTAEAYRGVSDSENTAVNKIIQALEAAPEPVVKIWDPNNPFDK